MAKFAPVGQIHVNPEAVELVESRANGLIAFTFTDHTFTSIDATAAGDPNDLSEIKQSFEALNVYLVEVASVLVNPVYVARVEDYYSGSTIIFTSGHRRHLEVSKDTVIALLDERANGQPVVNTTGSLDSFALAYVASGSGDTLDATALFSVSNLYAGELPDGITFTNGNISGFEAGRWLIVPGIAYRSATANSLPRLRTDVNGLDEVGIVRPNYPVANELVFNSYAFVKNLSPGSAVKLIYGNNGQESDYIIRVSFVKLAAEAAVIPNPNNILTIGGIVVDINGNTIGF